MRWRVEDVQFVVSGRDVDYRDVQLVVRGRDGECSERSHYFPKSYLEERDLNSIKSYADRLTKIRPNIC